MYVSWGNLSSNKIQCSKCLVKVKSLIISYLHTSRSKYLQRATIMDQQSTNPLFGKMSGSATLNWQPPVVREYAFTCSCGFKCVENDSKIIMEHFKACKRSK